MNLDTALDLAERYTRFIPHHVREDAAQGAQVAVWRHWHPDATERDIRGWARTGAIDELRRMTRWRAHRTKWATPTPVDPTDAHQWPADNTDPAQIVADHLDALAYLAELETIDPRARVMLLRRAQGATLAEIGAAEGITESRVCQILAVHTRRLP